MYKTMDSSLPPRRLASTTCRMSLSGHHRAQGQSPLQTLMQMGFSKTRSEKALAATGCRGAQFAVEYLLHHVNDPALDDPTPREYILYLCPTGQLLAQLNDFYDQSQAKTGWNGAHNYLPHITLCSFFQAPDEAAGLLVNALHHCVEKMKSDLPTKLKLSHYRAQNFFGLYVAEEQNDVLKRLAAMFMRECSEFISGELGPMHVISTCFPWCSSYPVMNPKRIEVEPYLKSLHLTLAYQFEEAKKELLDQLVSKLDLNAACTWEFRLYSREQRVKTHEVHRARFSYCPQELDELELTSGEYVYVNMDATKQDGEQLWAEGISARTGLTGQFPINYVQRTAESNAWTLHKSISLAEGNGHAGGHTHVSPAHALLAVGGDDDTNSHISDTHSNCSSLLGSASDVCSNGSDNTQNSPKSRLLIVARHGERVDFTFGNWIPVCFDSSGQYTRKDLNQPKQLPIRNSPFEYFKDSPLTMIGLHQATLTGGGLADAGVHISHAYSSPAFRSIQTCSNILKELGLADSIAINIEPGLFEWMGWYPRLDTPVWIAPEQLRDNGYNINTAYVPVISAEELIKDRGNETIEDFYDRSFAVATKVLSTTTCNVLLVGHASSVDTCTRQLVGKPPRSQHELISMVHKVPFVGLSAVEEGPNGKWSLIKPPTFTLQHLNNQRYDWKMLKSEKIDK